MKTTVFKKSLTAFNLLFVATFVVLALYSAIGQQIFPYIGEYRIELEQYLGKQLNGDVEIRKLNGDMEILTPSVHIEGITLHTEDYPDQPQISIAAVDAVLDSRASLFNLTPVFKTVRLSGLYVRIDADNNKPQNPIEEDDAVLVKRLIDTLLLQQNVELNNVTIENIRGDETKILQLDHLTMTGDGFNRLITGDVSYGNENKVNAGIRLYSQGSPFNLDSFYARGALDLPDVDVDYWINEIFDVSIFQEFSASAQLRFEFKNGLLNYSKLTVESPTVYINDGRKIDSVSAHIWGQQRALDSWTFWVKDSQFSLKETNWQFENIALGISQSAQGSRWQTYIKSLDIDYLHQFLNTLNLLPKDIKTLLGELSPSGRVENMNLVVQSKPNSDLTFTVASDIKNVSTHASGAIPAVKNINGVLAASEKNGRVQFKGPEVTLNFADIYQDPFFFPYAQGQVDWFITEQGVRLVGDGLSLVGEQIETIKGGFKLWLNNDEKFDDKLELNLSITNADVSAHKALVPNILSSELRAWLDSALLTGDVETGQYYLYTGLDKTSLTQSELQLSVAGAALQYLPPWPIVSDINGHLFVQDDRVYAQIDHALTLGGDIKHTQVVFDGSDRNQLWIQSQVQGSASEGLSYFKYTPLQTLVEGGLDLWTLSGRHTTQLGLKIPLEENNDDIVADVSTQIAKADLHLTDIDLAFNQTQGQIRYRTSKGLTSSTIRSSLWAQPLSLAITSDVHEEGFDFNIGFNGRVEMASVKQWLDLSLLNPLSGGALMSGNFSVNGRKNGKITLDLSSDLTGINIPLPQPFFKAEKTPQDFNLKLNLEQGQKLKLNYAEKVNVAMHIDEGELKAGQVYLGSTEAYIPNAQGIEVQGHVSEIDVNEWLKIWEQVQPDTAQKTSSSNSTLASDQSEPSLINRVNVSTDKLVYSGYEFEQVSADVTTRGNAWDIYVEAPIAKGLVTLSNSEPIVLDLDYIHWPAMVDDETNEQTGDQAVDPLVDIFPSMFPDMDLKVDEIFVGPRNYGRWQGRLRSEGDVLSLTDIDGKIKKLEAKGNVTWRKPKDNTQAQNTTVQLKLFSDDVGGIQKAWRSKPVIEANNAKVNLDFQWQGSPTDVKTEVLNGKASVSLKDGRFLDAGDTGALSAFGILNFGAIGRRLRLDFSDVYQSGLHFDSVSGKVAVKDGLMNIVDTLDIKGPSAKFAVSGTVNLNTKELDQELSVTFPLTSTLPFVAILAGFAPPVAASIFVGEQLVGDEIEKYTSATYKLKGTWDEPDLKIMKRFDNDIKGKQDEGFWYRMKDFFGLGDD